MHDLGHVLGFDHVEGRTQLMYPENVRRTSYGAGDLAGLELLGNGPCR